MSGRSEPHAFTLATVVAHRTRVLHLPVYRQPLQIRTLLLKRKELLLKLLL